MGVDFLRTSIFVVGILIVVSTAPIRETVDVEPAVQYTNRINASVSSNCDKTGEVTHRDTGDTVVSFGVAPWTVNQELVSSGSCPEPLLSICGASDDPSSFVSPFFEGDIVVNDETRRMIDESKVRIERQRELAKARRKAKANEEVDKKETTGGTGDVGLISVDRQGTVTRVIQSGNRRVVISSSSSSSSGIQRSGTYYQSNTGVTSNGGVTRRQQSWSSFSSSRRTKRALVKPKAFRWDDGVIPYTVDNNLPEDYKTMIRLGMRHWERRTCVRFINKMERHEDYLRFAFYPGCWSFIGKQGGEQILSVGFSCNTMRTIVHELGHAIGMWHEQSRRDRDKYIRIIHSNIAPGAEENFNKVDIANITSLGFPYDFDSVMHYDGLAFTKNGAPTMKVRKEYREVPTTDLGMRDRLSDLDIAQINAMYECNQKQSVDEDCFESAAGDGREYRGDIDFTEDFTTCQKWSVQWPNIHEQYSDKERRNERNGIGEHNHCRNPDGRRERPWCFTTKKKNRWQYCPITLC